MLDQEIKDKIGQLLMVGFPSPNVDDQVRRALKEYRVGNYIYFSRNIVTAKQTAELSKELSDLVFDELGVCPLISTDQEGGAVSRLTEGALLIPGAAAVGAASDDCSEQKLERVRLLGENLGKMLRAGGINVDLAPDADTNIEPHNPVIGARSYNDDPEKVGRIASAMLTGLQQGGVIAAVKHFPGHGNVDVDSHLGIPTNNTSKQQLQKTEFKPFAMAVEAGAKAILSGHVRYTEIDPIYPGTLSKTIETDLVREQFGFDGIIFTDCMEMDAIGKEYGTGEGAVLALLAGVDIVTISHTFEALKDAAESIYAAVESGRLSRERIEQSYERVTELKKQMGLMKKQNVTAAVAQEEAQDPEKLRLNEEIMHDALTLVSGTMSFDVSQPNFVTIAPDMKALTGAEDMKSLSFVEEMSERFGSLGIKMPLNADEKELEDVSSYVDSVVKIGFKRFVVGLFNAQFREGQLKVLQKIVTVPGAEVLIVLLGTPYDIEKVQRLSPFETPNVVCSYDYTSLSIRILLEALETKEFVGKLPFHKIQPDTTV